MYINELEIYKNVARTTSSPRETEARVLAEGALKLKQCMDRWESDERNRLLSEALRYNQQIWSIFQADLSSVDSHLPADLRLNLLKLGAFVDKQIFTVMAYPSPDKLMPIINVNLGIAAGLRMKPGMQTDETPSTATGNLAIKG